MTLIPYVYILIVELSELVLVINLLFDSISNIIDLSIFNING